MSSYEASTITGLIKVVRALPQAAYLFVKPSPVPTYQAITSWTRSNYTSISAPTLLYTYGVTTSSLTGIAKQISSFTSSIDGTQKEVLVLEKQSGISLTRSAALETEISSLSKSLSSLTKLSGQYSSTIIGLTRESTLMNTYTSKAQALYTSSVTGLVPYQTILSNKEERDINTNYDYKTSLITYSNAIATYSNYAKGLSTIRLSIPSLSKAANTSSLAYMTAYRVRKSKEGVVASTISTIGEYTTAIPIYKTAEIDAAHRKLDAQTDLSEAILYKTLSDFYISSNDLRASKESLEAGHIQAGGAIHESSNFLNHLRDPVVKAAYEMARYTYYQLGGSLELVVAQYNSTVSGIQTFETDVLGRVEANRRALYTPLEKVIRESEAASLIQATRIVDITSTIAGYDDEDLYYKRSSDNIAITIPGLTSTLSTATGVKLQCDVAYSLAESAINPLKTAYEDLVSTIEQKQIDSSKLTEFVNTLSDQLESTTYGMQTLQEDYDTAYSRYIDIGSAVDAKQREMDTANATLAAENSLGAKETRKVERATDFLSYLDILELIAVQRVKESDARSSRKGLYDELSKRREQLDIVAESIGVDEPNLNDPTYVGIKDQITLIDKYLDSDYEEFSKAAIVFKTEMNALEQLFKDYDDVEQTLQILTTGQTGGAPQVVAPLSSGSQQSDAVKLQLQQLANMDQQIKDKKYILDSTAKQIKQMIVVLQKNEDIFIPASAQAKTEEEIAAAKANPI